MELMNVAPLDLSAHQRRHTMNLETASKADMNAALATPLSASALKKIAREKLVAMVLVQDDAPTPDQMRRDESNHWGVEPDDEELTPAPESKDAQTIVDVALIEAVKAHAVSNYAKGWDVVVETMSDADVARVIEGANTPAAAIKRMKADIAPFNEQRDAHKREADAGNPKPAPAPKALRVLEDRIVQAPATDLKHVKPINEGTKKHLIA
ncbi:MAG: hypothetical protein ABI459_06030, partial [Deltaproteobacteria bacterium]